MRRRHTAPAMAALLLAACSAATEPGAASLSATDARRAATVLASLSTTPDFADADVPNGIVDCPVGGTVRTTLLSSAAGTQRLGVVLSGCAINDDAGQRWTFTSQPRLELAVTPTVTDTLLTLVTRTSGTVRVESGTVRGTCRIDTQLQGELRLQGAGSSRIRQTGTTCGQSVDSDWIIIPNPPGS